MTRANKAKASRFSWQSCGSQPAVLRSAPAAHALAGLPDGAGLVLMDPAEVPNQSECGADALRATTSQLFSEGENGASKE